MSKYTFLNKWHSKMQYQLNGLAKYWKLRSYRIKNYSKIYNSQEYDQVIETMDSKFTWLTDIYYITSAYFFDRRNFHCSYPEAFVYWVNKIEKREEPYPENELYPIQLMLDIVDIVKTSILRLQRISCDLHMPPHDLLIYSKLLLIIYHIEEHLFTLHYYNIRNLKKYMLTLEEKNTENQGA